jgi:predicted RNA-binding protein YlxR (DUF448 family)
MMTPSPQPSKHERTCVGCAKKGAPEAMVRLVAGVNGEVAVDAAGGAFGRGAHVHPFGDCIERACRGGLSRAFKRDIKQDPKALRASIREAYLRRAVGMLMGARRAGHLVLGADAVRDAKNASLVLLAADAGTIAARFEREIASGRAVAFGTKAELGELFGTGETAVLAVCHQGVARALLDVLSIARAEGTRGDEGLEER